MQRVKEINASLPCGLLYSAILVHPWTYATSMNMEALHPHYAQLYTPGFVSSAHERNVRVHAWTIDEASKMRHAFLSGVDIVITNHPDKALKVLEKQ